MTKKPYLLLLNDIHFGKDNLPEAINNWNEAIEIATKHNISNIVVGGDMWQSRSSQTLNTLLAVQKCLMAAIQRGFSVYLAEGNHDLVNQNELKGYNHVFAGLPGIYPIKKWHTFKLAGNIKFITMSYFPENNGFNDILTEVLNTEGDPANIILYIHEGISGALKREGNSELPAELFKDFKAVLSGHYHDRCKIGDNIEYIGASRQHNFGEDEEKGYTIVYFDGEIKFIKNQVNTRFKTLCLTVNDACKLNESQLNIDGYKIRVKIKGDSAEALAIDKQTLFSLGASKVEIIKENLTTHGDNNIFETKWDKNGIKTEYIRFCHQKGINDSSLGLKYLDKIK